MAIPTRSPYIIIGAGIHGLSTAYHLALQLKKPRTRRGSLYNDFDASTGFTETPI